MLFPSFLPFFRSFRIEFDLCSFFFYFVSLHFFFMLIHFYVFYLFCFLSNWIESNRIDIEIANHDHCRRHHANSQHEIVEWKTRKWKRRFIRQWKKRRPLTMSKRRFWIDISPISMKRSSCIAMKSSRKSIHFIRRNWPKRRDDMQRLAQNLKRPKTRHKKYIKRIHHKSHRFPHAKCKNWSWRSANFIWA